MPQPDVKIGPGSASGDPRAVLVDPKLARPRIPDTATDNPGGLRLVKKTTKKPAGKKPTTKKPDKATAPKEIDPKKLTEADARERCAAIYRLEKKVDAKRAVHELAKAGAKSARAALKEASEAFAKEIHEQRFGPGPLFTPDGKGPA